MERLEISADRICDVLVAGAGLAGLTAAIALAKAEKKVVLLDFTGSDWCGICKRLNKEVFSTPEFVQYAAKNLVLVEVDSSWLPYLAEQMNDRFQRAAAASRPDIKRLPSEYFTDTIFSTFITDRYGIKNRHEIGVGEQLFGPRECVERGELDEEQRDYVSTARLCAE